MTSYGQTFYIFGICGWWPFIWCITRHGWRKLDFFVCDVTVTSHDVILAKKLYIRNLWLKTFDLMCYSTLLGEIRFFRKFRPGANFSRSKSKVTVKVMSDGPWVMLSDKLNLKCLWQLELKLCSNMCFSPFAWPWPWPLTLNFQKLIDWSRQPSYETGVTAW